MIRNEIFEDSVYKIEVLDNGFEIKQYIGREIIEEEIKNEQGEVIETITKKFNLQTGEYEASERVLL